MTAIEIQIENVRKLPRREKLRIMETLWEDLSRTEEEVESPAWHRHVLEKTQLKMTAGRESMTDWSEAKQGLRARFE